MYVRYIGTSICYVTQVSLIQIQRSDGAVSTAATVLTQRRSKTGKSDTLYLRILLYIYILAYSYIYICLCVHIHAYCYIHSLYIYIYIYSQLFCLLFWYRLLEATDKLSASFLLQDFRCKKTHRVARRLGSAVSDLCDPLVMDTSREAALQQLQTLRQVATFHGFTVLKEAVEELMI